MNCHLVYNLSFMMEEDESYKIFTIPCSSFKNMVETARYLKKRYPNQTPSVLCFYKQNNGKISGYGYSEHKTQLMQTWINEKICQKEK